MKKTLLILGLVGLVSLSVYGWGCAKKTSFQAPINQAQNTNVKTADVEPVEPQPLAYLLLTKDAKVTVYRGNQQTSGMNEMELYAGDEVQVVSGEARLLYPDTGMSVLLPGTKVTLVPKGTPKKKGLGLDLWLEAGSLWTRLERLLGSDESFSVTGSNVVATVRGTAFGMKLDNGQVEVEVADKTVKVSTQVILNTGKLWENSVNISAGNAIRLNTADLAKTADIKNIMQRGIRTLTPVERAGLGYRFGLMRLAPSVLQRPQVPVRWSAPISLDKIKDILSSLTLTRWQAYSQWILQNQTLLRATEAQLQTNPLPVRFVAPLEQAVLQAPTTTPSVRGPSS